MTDCTWDQSWRLSSGDRSSSANWGATPPIDGIRSLATARRASSARHRPRMWVRAASRRYQGSLSMKPTWANWVEASIAGPPVPPSATAGAQAPPVSASATAASCRSAKTAPLGCPVVPEVNTRATVRSGSPGSTGTSTEAAASAAAPPASSSVTSPGSDSASTGSVSSTTPARSGGARRGFTPAVTAPNLARAA